MNPQKEKKAFLEESGGASSVQGEQELMKKPLSFQMKMQRIEIFFTPGDKSFYVERVQRLECFGTMREEISSLCLALPQEQD